MTPEQRAAMQRAAIEDAMRRSQDMTPAQAGTTQYSFDRLKPLVESGQASPAEVAEFQRLSAAMPAAKATSGATSARYRGALVGATGGLSDEAAGALGFARGDGYQAGREAHLARNQEAQTDFPDAFGSGRMAGGALLGAASLGVGGPAVRGGLGLKTLAGGSMGALLGLGQGQADFELAGRPEGERFRFYQRPMAIGGATGAAAYPVGRLVGMGARGVRNARMPPRTGYGAVPSRTMARAVSNTQESGQDVRAYLSGLTDEAMLADVPGDLQGTAQGLAALRGPGGTQVARSITERAEGAGPRISAQMDESIRPANAAFLERRRLAAERAGTLGPEYDAAINAGGSVEVGPVIRRMDEAMRVAGPDTAPVLNRFASDLKSKAPNGLIDPAQLHWIRSDLSDALQGIDGKRNNIMRTALRDVDEVLDTVPGYADARTGYANNMAMERAMEEGQEAMRGSRATASSPDEFADYFDKLSEAQQEAFRTGLRRDIDALMGTSSNDAAAAWREFANKGWNAEKLRIALGDDAAEPIINRLRSEQVFSQTRGRVVAGSRTGETQEAREALGPYRDPQTGRQPGPLSRIKGVADDTVNSIIDSLLYRGTGKRNAQLGEMLTLTGDQRDRLVESLVNLSQRQGQPSITADRMDAVVRALLAASGGASAAAGQ